MDPEDQWETEHHDKVLRETLWGSNQSIQLRMTKSQAMHWFCAKETVSSVRTGV